jgi:hypothetical protein
MGINILGRHLVWSRPNGNGGTTFYYYYDEITWVVLALALAWVAWLFVARYRRARALRRPPPRRIDRRLLRRVVRLKQELSAAFMRPGFSANIHAVGVGVLAATGEYCIQVFVADATRELWHGVGATRLPEDFRGVPLRLYEMAPADFLSAAGDGPPAAATPVQYPEGIRDPQEVIVGGISAANTNLTGQSGTIGYFCTRRSRLPLRAAAKPLHFFSNYHVLGDMRRTNVDDSDLIMQPSPGEPSSNRPIGTLVSFSAVKFGGTTDEANRVDAALARLWEPQRHKPLIPCIGAVKGYVPKEEVEAGEAARKFGRTTGYTEGRVFSIYLDIRVRYDRTGQSALFRDQFLIEPAAPRFTSFVKKGDSGSVVVDGGRHAFGLIFAGAPEVPESTLARPHAEPADAAAAGEPRRIENYGVANPISEVLDRLRIDLLV